MDTLIYFISKFLTIILLGGFAVIIASGTITVEDKRNKALPAIMIFLLMVAIFLELFF